MPPLVVFLDNQSQCSLHWFGRKGNHVFLLTNFTITCESSRDPEMSKATKRKHVTKEVLDDFVLPTPEQSIVKIVASRGNNLHEVEDSSGEKYLISMPTKFRKNIWIKRGDYVLTAPIEEGDKVKAEIVNILYKDQIKYIKEEGLWPKSFEDKKEEGGNLIPDDMLPPSGSEEEDEKETEQGRVANPNRPAVQYEDSSSSDSDENGTV